jgi:hypothetical protein
MSKRERLVYVPAGPVININSANAYKMFYGVPEDVAKARGFLRHAKSVDDVAEESVAPCPSWRPDAGLKTLADLAKVVRRDNSRQGMVARLLDMVHEHDQISFEELGDKVHQADVYDEAIERQIKAARGWIKQFRLPFELVVCDRRLLRREISEK